MKSIKIIFAGGDKRQYYAAKKLMREGISAFLYGFEKLGSSDVPSADNLSFADVIVLPLTGLKENAVPCYYSDKEIKLDELKSVKDKLFVMGKAKTLGEGFEVYDLLRRGDFAVLNALPSAEGAVAVALENYEGTIFGSKCLVTGYGRTGRALTRALRALNAEVTVTSRSSEKLAEVITNGCGAIKTGELKSLDGFDIVFNTADALVIDEKTLRACSQNNALIIDLASLPGGVDFSAAKKLGFRTIHALGLPGKYSPKAAGEIISDTILNILEEEYNWRRLT